MYRIDEALPSAEEFRELRRAVGWTAPEPEACRTALRTTVYGVVARHRDRAVGMARLIGDRGLYLMVVDVAVHPEHQGAGLGRRMVGALTDWARAQGVRHTLLAAEAGAVPFYESLGFAVQQDRLMRLTPAG
ncbi:GNAT family N-acetyltransferase [Kitasatospora sp. NPDC006697]|uniref:GNAT family N-acetyltransferase n=1 Tax=Kitasatospora sp. NPDC006697 TaxID=3364020 RepID=UPI0036775E91